MLTAGDGECRAAGAAETGGRHTSRLHHQGQCPAHQRAPLSQGQPWVVFVS